MNSARLWKWPNLQPANSTFSKPKAVPKPITNSASWKWSSCRKQDKYPSYKRKSPDSHKNRGFPFICRISFSRKFYHTAIHIASGKGFQAHLHQIVTGIDLAILQQRRLLSEHEIDFLHPVHLVGIQTLKLHGQYRFIKARMHGVTE